VTRMCRKMKEGLKLEHLMLFCTEPIEPKDMPSGHIVSLDLINCVRMFNILNKLVPSSCSNGERTSVDGKTLIYI